MTDNEIHGMRDLGMTVMVACALLEWISNLRHMQTIGTIALVYWALSYVIEWAQRWRAKIKQ